jgi:hypothetical protein
VNRDITSLRLVAPPFTAVAARSSRTKRRRNLSASAGIVDSDVALDRGRIAITTRTAGKPIAGSWDMKLAPVGCVSVQDHGVFRLLAKLNSKPSGLTLRSCTLYQCSGADTPQMGTKWQENRWHSSI